MSAWRLTQGGYLWRDSLGTCMALRLSKRFVVLCEFGALCLIVAGLFFWAVIYRATPWGMRGIVPPESVDTLEEFKQDMPTPDHVYFRDSSEETFLVVGPLKESTFPSGPPAYIFDSCGRLKYWSRDIGDDYDSQAAMAAHSGNWQEISLDRAIQIAQSNSTRRD